MGSSGVSRRTVMEGAAALAATLPFTELSAQAGPSPSPADMRLWYRQPARAWIEALPVGNGRLGAMIFGDTIRERLQLNEDTLWTGGPYNPVNPSASGALAEVRRLITAGSFAEAEALADAKLISIPRTQMAYQALGDLYLELPKPNAGGVEDYTRDLDLDTAVATTRFTLNNVRFRREVFASAPDAVIVVRMTADAPFDLAVGMASAQPDTRVEADGPMLTLTGRNSGRAGVSGALRFAARTRAIVDGGSVQATRDRLQVMGTRGVTILIAMATSYRRFDDTGGDPERSTRNTLDQAAAKDFDRLRADAVIAHQSLFRRVSIDLGQTPAAVQPTDVRVRTNRPQEDPALAALYFAYGRYLMIASSQPGTQAANLQGLWNESNDPPWQSKYTVNINTQMNYWPAEVTALPECTEPLIAMVRDLAVTGERTARAMYGARGWVCHHNTDLWRATAPIDGAQWGMWPLGGAWLCTHLWERYDYGRDRRYLQSVYPLIRGAALFFLDTLQHDPVSGALVTSPSLSPENRHPKGASVCAGPAMDRQILRDLFDQAAQAAEILGIDADFAAEVRRARAQLAPDRIGAAGQLQEWLEDWDTQAPEPDHRHVSHLYALFPSDQIDPERTPALATAARRSLEMRGDETTGWATAWRANLWARLGDGERAHRILSLLLGPERTYPNLFDAHPPFQIDGNFGGTRAIAEMLMQSRGEEIILLPALPGAWRDGSITGLRARGRIQIDLRWSAGRVEEAVLIAGENCRRHVRRGTKTIEVALIKGQRFTLRGDTLAQA